VFLRTWFGAGLLAMGLTLGGCFPAVNTQDEEKNPYFIAGKDRVSARDYSGAIEAFEKTLEVNPRSALAHYELGVLFEQRENDYPAAIYHYNKVLKLRPQGTYPAENARQRIPGCRLEMIKDDTLATLNPVAMHEIDRLRKENQQLRQYLETWSAWWQKNSNRLQAPQLPRHSAAPSERAPSGSASAFAVPAGARPAAEAARPAGRSAAPATASRRTHKVQPGETPMRLSRKYGIPVEAILAANPGLDARKMKAGQTVNIP
jgi:hypothetical protein